MSLSVIIPARDEKFLSKTVDDLFAKATEELEVIVILDGCWADPPLNKHKNLIVIHRGKVHGMRPNINAAARTAAGKYIMKLDGHCIVGEGFDKILKADCESNWLVVPSRYSLDGDKWERTKGPIDYLMLTFPYVHDDLYGKGLHGRKWKGKGGLEGSFWHREKERKDILIDDIMTFQGSCWFMHKENFFNIDCMDVNMYSIFQEAQELGFKVWLSGGRVVRNKKTWYAHLHKGKKHGTKYGLSKKAKLEAEGKTVDYWMNNRWPKQTRKFEWFVNHFWPIDGWPKNWMDHAA